MLLPGFLYPAGSGTVFSILAVTFSTFPLLVSLCGSRPMFMAEPDRTEEYLDELEQHLDDLPRPDERSFYLLLIEMANVRAQLSMLT